MRSIASATPSNDNVGRLMCSERHARQTLILQLSAVEAVLNQRGVIAPVSLCGLFGFQQRLPLPIRIAPTPIPF